MKDVEQRRRIEASKKGVELKRRAGELGFDATGIATLERNAHAAELDRWLAAGHAGTMTYLHRQAAKRKDPTRIMPQARVAVVTLTNYFHGRLTPCPPLHDVERGNEGARPRVAQYAWSSDYHHVLGARLEQLAAAIREVVPGAVTRAYVDAGPVPERELAQRAGLGWIGKNMMLIHPEIGSFTFIGVVLTDADLAPDLPFDADRCGTCRRCLDACPTHAFAGPGDLDARACISYLTIEHRGAFSHEQRADVGGWLFGCDVCQDVCPWNVSFAQATADPGFAVRPDIAEPDLRALIEIDDAEFARRYGDTPFARPGAAGMRRNAAAVLARAGKGA
ncbi:MAG TPA: tRNA epoxyqueuosine(34) reductase QueG [Gemmatimonadales bacterium]|jgi:epoxyqueuosine reductase|nr:tRNA epoxyqueuosine(34) reductase QueG [Gemmatimonadales bacterium]